VEPEDVDGGDDQEDHLQPEPHVVVVIHRLGQEEDEPRHDHQGEADDGVGQHLVVDLRERRGLEGDAQHSEVDDPDRARKQHQRQDVGALKQRPQVEGAKKLLAPGGLKGLAIAEVLLQPSEEFVEHSANLPCRAGAVAAPAIWSFRTLMPRR